jgi:hypothetical protein
MKTIIKKVGPILALKWPGRPDPPSSRNQIISFDYPSLPADEIGNHLRAVKIGDGAARMEVMQQACLERNGFRLLVDRNDDLAVWKEKLCILAQQIKRIARVVQHFVKHDAIPAVAPCCKVLRRSIGNLFPAIQRLGRRFNAKVGQVGRKEISQHGFAAADIQHLPLGEFCNQTSDMLIARGLLGASQPLPVSEVIVPILHAKRLVPEMPASRQKAMKTIWCVLVLAVSAGATNYTVKSGGGGNYSTIQACATAMSAGDTCTVYAGTYNENITVSAGSAGNYKTLTVNPGDTVYVLNFTLNSHTKVNGFHIQNTSSPSGQSCVSITGNSTDYYITNNTMYACGGSSMIDEVANGGDNTTYGYIQGNTLSYPCSTSGAPNVCRGITVSGDYHLIENNDISHTSDGIYVFGKHNILRKNNFHDQNSNDCGSNSSNCHIDFMQADASIPATQPSQYLLIENNTALNMVGSNMHAVGILQAQACGGQCFNAIVRFHKAVHIGSGGIVDDNSGQDSPAGWSNVKSYNNTWADAGNENTAGGNGLSGFMHTSTGGSVINDIYYFPFALSNWYPYFADSLSIPFTARNNLGFCTTTPCQIYVGMYGNSSAWTSEPGNIGTSTDPQFASYSSTGLGNLSLASGSPAIGAGTNLTTALDSGSSSSSLVVADASYFQDNPGGLIGVQPDCIRIGATTTACIAQGGIHYSTNTITLASPASWNNGDPVYIYKISDGTVVLPNGQANPNMGAMFDSASASAPAAPTGLTAAVQ